MSRINLVVNLLNELQSGDNLLTLESLQTLLTEMEEKIDPDPIEIELVSVGYQLLENLQLLKEILRRYQIKKRELPGNKLSELYEERDW